MPRLVFGSPEQTDQRDLKRDFLPLLHMDMIPKDSIALPANLLVIQCLPMFFPTAGKVTFNPRAKNSEMKKEFASASFWLYYCLVEPLSSEKDHFGCIRT